MGLKFLNVRFKYHSYKSNLLLLGHIFTSMLMLYRTLNPKTLNKPFIFAV